MKTFIFLFAIFLTPFSFCMEDADCEIGKFCIDNVCKLCHTNDDCLIRPNKICNPHNTCSQRAGDADCGDFQSCSLDFSYCTCEDDTDCDKINYKNATCTFVCAIDETDSYYCQCVDMSSCLPPYKIYDVLQKDV